MGALNCKCDAKEEKSVVVEDQGRAKYNRPAEPKLSKAKLSDEIFLDLECLSPECKQIYKKLPKFQYKEEDEEILDWNILTLMNGKYFGETVFNMPHGRGVEVLKNGGLIQGYWREGKLSGKGRAIYANGDYFEGNYLNGKMNGQGILIGKNGAIYDGNWVDSKQSGIGKEIWPDGAEYFGEFQNGFKSGKGNFFWKDGCKYDGEFFKNLMQGYGTYVWSDGRKYEGMWLDNKMHGNGVFYWPDGRVYKGKFSKNKKIDWKQCSKNGKGNVSPTENFTNFSIRSTNED